MLHTILIVKGALLSMKMAALALKLTKRKSDKRLSIFAKSTCKTSKPSLGAKLRKVILHLMTLI